jgi:Putative addiction module component
MTDLIAELSAQAKALPPQARARLAEELLASLEPHDAEVEAARDEQQARRRRQRVANALASLRANRFDLDGSLKDWIGRGSG